MSFIVGRLAAGREGAYFLQESKQAVGRLAEKTSNRSPAAAVHETIENEADILPEILKHNLPSKIFQPLSDSTLSTGSKWLLHPDENNGVSFVYRNAINPISSYVSLPQASFGPKRWRLPNTENSFSASTANDLRLDKYSPVNSERSKETAAGLSEIAKAFAGATLIVFGGGTLMIGLAVPHLEQHTIHDIRTKGKDMVKPKIETIKKQMTPLRTWAEGVGKKWHMETEEVMKEKPAIKELRRMLGAKIST